MAEVLEHGEIEILGRFAASSNVTLLVACSLGSERVEAVYKPERGERPLWDFPRGLDRRELAAYQLSETLGWHLVPTTILRHDAPLGRGSLQRLVADDGESHYFTLIEQPTYHDVLRKVAVFDVVANNADRKSGHVLAGEGRLWAIDHGLCFHAEPKLRTVIWDFAGQPLPRDVAGDLERLVAQAPASVPAALLEERERAAVVERAGALLRHGTLPEPTPRGDWPPYPWPLV